MDLDRNEPRSEVINSIFSNAFIALKVCIHTGHTQIPRLSLSDIKMEQTSMSKFTNASMHSRVDIMTSKFTNALERLHQYQDE